MERKHKEIFLRYLDQVDPQQLLTYLPCLSKSSRETVNYAQRSVSRSYAAQVLHSQLERRPEGFRQLVLALRHENVDCTELADLLDPQHCYDPSNEGLLSDLVMSRIAAKLGFEWNQVALELGLTQANIEQIQISHKYEGAHKMILSALLKWRDNSGGSNEEKKEILMQALRDGNRHDLADELMSQYTGLLSDLVMSRIAAKLGFEWIQVALELGLTQANIEQIQISHKYEGVHKMILSALLKWRDNSGGSNKEKKEILMQALRDGNRHDLADELMSQYTGISLFQMPLSGPSNRSPYPTSNDGYPHTNSNAEQSKAKIPDDKELTSISCKIGNNWEILGIQLGVPSHYIDQIKAENTPLLMRIYEMLSIWRKMKSSEATMKNLLLNLRKVSDAVNIDWNGLAKIFNPCLKIGSNVNNEYGGTVCVGPFVRLQETGEICFVTARHNFLSHEILGFKVSYPDSEDQIQAICGEVIAASQELDTALVKISNDFIPNRCTFVDIERDDLSRAGLKFPYRLTGATDLGKLNPETNTEKRIVVHCPNGRLLTGTLDSEKIITLDTDSPECPHGTSGSAVCLVEDNYSLSCIGILVGMRMFQSKNILFIIFQDILEQFSIELGQSLVMETFEDRKETDFLLDPNDAYIFNEALRKGSGKDRFVRINVVGNFRQGKTSLTRRLMNQSLEDIESTDGIDVHVQKCKIKDSEWVSSSTELFENDYMLRLAEESNRMKAPKTSEMINNKYAFNAASLEKGNNTSPDDEIAESFVKSVSDNPLQRPETETSDSISLSIEGSENSSSEAETDTSFIKKYSSQLKDNMDMPLDNTLSANIWDFGGQFIYYATHQIFHSRDAIYLLVFNLSEDLNESIIDKDFPERKESMRNCLKFWLDSIHAYAGSEEEGLTFENVTKPIVILVGTFKDQFKGNLEEKFYDALDTFVDDLSARGHLLPEQYAVSTTDMSDNEIQKLKEKIYKIGIDHAERNRVPLKWIPLEIALLAEKSKNILTFDEVEKLNTENENLVEKEELKTFLKYLHLKGTLIFFDEEDLESHIVVNPQYLVDAFRCVIGSKSCIKDAKVHHLWNRLNETAILENDLLDVMWKKEVEKEFLKHKEVLLMFLQRHRILSKLFIMDEAGNISYQDKFMIPSLLKHRCEQQELQIFTDVKCATLVSLGLRIENTALLTSLFGRITAGALGKWPPVVKDKRVFVFQNIGLFILDLEHVGKVELKLGKGIQLTVINQCPEIKVESKVCDSFRRYIESLIKHDFQKRRNRMYNGNCYKHYLACNDMSHDGKGSEETYDMDDVRNKERARCPDYHPHTIEFKSAIDEWFPPDKVTELYRIENRPITKKELSAIAGCIGNNWRLLGVDLDVNDIELDQIEMDYRNQTATCIYKMLCMWEQKHQDDATLLQLITSIERKPYVNVNKDMIKNIIEGN